MSLVRHRTNTAWNFSVDNVEHLGEPWDIVMDGIRLEGTQDRTTRMVRAFSLDMPLSLAHSPSDAHRIFEEKYASFLRSPCHVEEFYGAVAVPSDPEAFLGEGWIQVFVPGKYPQSPDPYTLQDLVDMCESYDPITQMEAPLTKDHMHTGPSFGWADRLEIRDGNLWAHFRQVDESVAYEVREGRWKHISAEIYRNYNGSGKCYFGAASLLGAQPPQIKGMAVPLFFQDQHGERVAFSSIYDESDVTRACVEDIPMIDDMDTTYTPVSIASVLANAATESQSALALSVYLQQIQEARESCCLSAAQKVSEYTRLTTEFLAAIQSLPSEQVAAAGIVMGDGLNEMAEIDAHDNPDDTVSDTPASDEEGSTTDATDVEPAAVTLQGDSNMPETQEMDIKALVRDGVAEVFQELKAEHAATIATLTEGAAETAKTFAEAEATWTAEREVFSAKVTTLEESVASTIVERDALAARVAEAEVAASDAKFAETKSQIDTWAQKAIAEGKLTPAVVNSPEFEGFCTVLAQSKMSVGDTEVDALSVFQKFIGTSAPIVELQEVTGDADAKNKMGGSSQTYEFASEDSAALAMRADSIQAERKCSWPEALTFASQELADVESA